MLTQVHPLIEFSVEGLATVLVGVSGQNYYCGINCQSTVNNGSSITWARSDHKPITIPLKMINNGVQLDLSKVTAKDLAKYVCMDENDQVFITLTTG